VRDRRDHARADSDEIYFREAVQDIRSFLDGSPVRELQ
jgi:hypothetical protein